MLGGRSALLGAAGSGNPYGNWTGNYSDVSLLLRNGTPSTVLILLDESPSPKTLTLSGAAAITTTAGEWKYSGSALSFTKSTNSYIQAGTGNDPAFNFGSGDFTIEAWVRLPTVSGVNFVVSTMVGPYSAEGWAVDIINGQLRFLTYNASTSPTIAISGGTISLNTYTHIAVTRAGTTLRGFVSGVQVWSTTISGNLITTNAYSQLLRVGRAAYTDAVYDYGGQIDDLRITKGVARYTANFTPPTAELPANVTDDPSYNSVSLLLRNGTPSTVTVLIPLDESPSPKEVTALGNAGFSTSIKQYGTSSMVFDGSGDYFDTSATTDFDFGNNPFTIEAWINVSVLTSVAGVVSVMNNLPDALIDGYVLVADSDGRLRFLDYVDGLPSLNLSSATGLIAPSTWYHVAVCKEGTGTNQLRLFINGQIVASGTQNANIPIATSGQPARIGAWRYPSAPRFFNGYIDDLRITKGVARYTKNFLPPPAELPAI